MKSQAFRVNFRIKNPDRFSKIVAILFMFTLLLRNLWISDDAFITLRVVDNFVHGFGLVWNVGERVQVYIHPLWLFLVTMVYSIKEDPYVVLYFVSMLTSLTAITLLVTQLARNYRTTILLTLVLCTSMSFIDYSSSGLENPLTHLLLVLLLLVIFRRNDPPLRRLFFVSLLASLAALNRMDSILFYLPLLAYQLWLNKENFWRTLGVVLAGFTPLLLWELFATLYYGFPLPNTYYTKVETGLQPYYLYEAGLAYFRNSFHWDPITLVTITLSLVSLFIRREMSKLMLGGGIVLYMLYILYIGGDFMSGRFFSAAFLLAVGLLLTFDYKAIFGPIMQKAYRLILIVVLLFGLSANNPPLLIKPDDKPVGSWDEYGIADEKLSYFQVTGWYNHLATTFQHDLAIQGERAREAGVSPVTQNVIGMFGYYAGPDIYVIDSVALADPLRSRLPAIGPSRIGHYNRPMPLGYEDTIRDNFNNHIENLDLRQYYDHLMVLCRDDLFAPGRLRTIIEFNLGRYNYLLYKYLEAPEPK